MQKSYRTKESLLLRLLIKRRRGENFWFNICLVQVYVWHPLSQVVEHSLNNACPLLFLVSTSDKPTQKDDPEKLKNEEEKPAAKAFEPECLSEKLSSAKEKIEILGDRIKSLLDDIKRGKEEIERKDKEIKRKDGEIQRKDDDIERMRKAFQSAL